jgi:cytochrome c
MSAEGAQVVQITKRALAIMQKQNSRRGALAAGIVLSGLFAATSAHAVDEAAALALAKKSDCLKCHAIDKKKDGPAYKEVAAKYKGKADAEQKLFTHLTTSPKVKIDGKEEEHTSLKTKDEAEIRNVVQWILSR